MILSADDHFGHRFPKACSIDHGTYALRCLNYGMTKGINKDERALMTLPVHFNAGRGSVMSILYLGGTIFIQEKFDELSVLETIEQERINLYHDGAGPMRAAAALRRARQFSNLVAPLSRHHRRPSFARDGAQHQEMNLSRPLRSLRFHRLRPDHGHRP
jgi:hypothetical protein